MQRSIHSKAELRAPRWLLSSCHWSVWQGTDTLSVYDPHTHPHGHHLPPNATWRDIWPAALSGRSVRMHLRASTGWFLSMVTSCVGMWLLLDIRTGGGAGWTAVTYGTESTWGWWSCGACWSYCSCRCSSVATHWDGRLLLLVSWISCRYGPSQYRSWFVWRQKVCLDIFSSVCLRSG